MYIYLQYDFHNDGILLGGLFLHCPSDEKTTEQKEKYMYNNLYTSK